MYTLTVIKMKDILFFVDELFLQEINYIFYEIFLNNISKTHISNKVLLGILTKSKKYIPLYSFFNEFKQHSY